MMITVKQERRNTRNGVVSLYCKTPQSDSLEGSFVNVVVLLNDAIAFNVQVVVFSDLVDKKKTLDYSRFLN